ncbi:MAG: hypothetical protein R2799_11640 [Crocinitomicaceae bacterium]
MSANLRKILVKLKQKWNNNPDRMVRIQNGPLKGFLWMLSISDSRYILGTYERVQTDLILREMKSSKSFADFGTNLGYYSLMIINALQMQRFSYLQLFQRHD